MHVIVPILQIKKLWLREVKYLAQSHGTGKDEILICFPFCFELQFLISGYGKRNTKMIMVQWLYRVSKNIHEAI